MDLARLSSVALMASGIAGVLMPDQVAAALDLTPSSQRGIAETRAGLGGTYAALGLWATLSQTPMARRAVGITWLGAGATRLAALKLDQPETDPAYWCYLAAELGLGTAAVAASLRRRA